MKKIIIMIGAFILHSVNGYCCTTCNKQLQDSIFDSAFYPNLLSMLSAFIVLGVIIVMMAILSTRRHNKRLLNNPQVILLSGVPLATAAVVLGIGVGGFIDGIFLHQILQWHEMLTNKIPGNTVLNKSVNMFWDGIFHLFTLITTIIGIILLWKVSKRDDLNKSGGLLTGGMLLGWGLFNIIEGVIDHHILKLHNVREITNSQVLWNYGFLAVSVCLIILGIMIIIKVPRKFKS
jgi:uncharacterized membrane protein